MIHHRLFFPRRKNKHGFSSLMILSYIFLILFLTFLSDLLPSMVSHFHREKHRFCANNSSRMLPRPHGKGRNFQQTPTRNIISQLTKRVLRKIGLLFLPPALLGWTGHSHNGPPPTKAGIIPREEGKPGQGFLHI